MEKNQDLRIYLTNHQVLFVINFKFFLITHRYFGAVGVQNPADYFAAVGVVL